MHEASIPADATHLKRATAAPNDEDGRDLRLSAADRSATEFYAAMIAHSGARPSVTKRQIAIKSLRTKATIVMRRIRPEASQHGPGTMPHGCSLVGSEAKARR